MNKITNKNFLSKFYKKKEKSLIDMLNSGIINFEIEDVHKFRVSIKKIHAMLQLIEMSEAGNFNLNNHYTVFKNLFKRFGELRDLQLNILFLEKLELHGTDILPFKNFLIKKKSDLRNEILEMLKNFDILPILETGNLVKKIGINIEKKKLIEKSIAFIAKESKEIEILQSSKNGADKIHKMRKHFKSLGAIAELLYNLKPLKYLKNFLRTIKRTEVKMGVWHDRVVFVSAVNEFLSLNKRAPKNEILPLINLSAKLSIENNEMANKFMPEINFILSNVIKIS